MTAQNVSEDFVCFVDRAAKLTFVKLVSDLRAAAAYRAASHFFAFLDYIAQIVVDGLVHRGRTLRSYVRTGS